MIMFQPLIFRGVSLLFVLGWVGKQDRAKADDEGKSPLLVASNKAGMFCLFFSPVQLGKKQMRIKKKDYRVS